MPELGSAEEHAPRAPTTSTVAERAATKRVFMVRSP
jgi:hypothetical protein